MKEMFGWLLRRYIEILRQKIVSKMILWPNMKVHYYLFELCSIIKCVLKNKKTHIKTAPMYIMIILISQRILKSRLKLHLNNKVSVID